MRKLGHISLIVKDTERLKKFYETLFGFVLDFETDDKLYVQYFTKGDDIKFDFEHDSLIKTDVPGSEYRGFLLRFEADDLEEISRNCLEFGGKVIRHPVEQSYGSVEMFLEDPEGNLIQVYKLNNN